MFDNPCAYEEENWLGDLLCTLQPKVESDSNEMYGYCIGHAVCGNYYERQGNTPEPTCFDNVSHPSHYTEGRKYEPKDVIRDWGLNFNLGNAVKYVARAGRKDDILQDLKKARQYLDFEIEYLEANK